METEVTIKELVDKIIADGVVTKKEYDELLETVHADGVVDAEEKEQIDRIYGLIKEGKVTIEP